MLFSFPSRYLFAIGFEKYLRLDVDATHLPARITTHGTRGHSSRCFHSYSYRAITFFGRSFQIVLIGVLSVGRSPYTTSLFPYRKKIRFALYRFPSPLLTVSRLISFPSGTKMFQFPEFPLLSECLTTGSPIRRFSDQGLLAPPRDISQLGTSFIGSQTEPSPRQFHRLHNPFCSLFNFDRSHRLFLTSYPSLMISCSQGAFKRAYHTY